jgi:hypothetical protein
METLIKFQEFLFTIQKNKKYPIETIGGFINWMKRQGFPKSYPFSKWKELLDKYVIRKV